MASIGNDGLLSSSSAGGASSGPTNPNSRNISASTATLSVANGTNRIDASANAVALTLPAVSTIPYDGFGFNVWIAKAVSDNSKPISFSVNGSASEDLMNPDTGAYQATTWSTSGRGAGTLQGTLFWIEWYAAGNVWLIEG